MNEDVDTRYVITIQNERQRIKEENENQTTIIHESNRVALIR